MDSNDNRELAYMELNESLLKAAKKLADRAEASHDPLPLEIPGFPDIFLALASDQTIAAMAAVQSSSGAQYKIGTRKS